MHIWASGLPNLLLCRSTHGLWDIPEEYSSSRHTRLLASAQGDGAEGCFLHQLSQSPCK